MDLDAFHKDYLKFKARLQPILDEYERYREHTANRDRDAADGAAEDHGTALVADQEPGENGEQGAFDLKGDGADDGPDQSGDHEKAADESLADLISDDPGKATSTGLPEDPIDPPAAPATPPDDDRNAIQ